MKQRDLLVGEWANFLAKDRDHAEDGIILAQRHLQRGPGATEIDKGKALWITGSVRLLGCEIDVVYEPLSTPETVGRRAGAGHLCVFGEERCVGLRDAAQRYGNVAILFQRPQTPKSRLAKMHRFFEHRIEHGGECAGRRADDPQHIRRGRLLLQGLSQFIEEPRVLNGDDGLFGEIVNQLDLLVGKGSNLLAVYDDGAN